MKEYTTEIKIPGEWEWVEVDSSNKVNDVIKTAQMFVGAIGAERVRIKEDGEVVVEG